MNKIFNSLLIITMVTLATLGFTEYQFFSGRNINVTLSDTNFISFVNDDDDSTVWNFTETNILPGDSGVEKIVIENTKDIDGYLNITFENLINDEMGCVEPEENDLNNPDTSCGSPGELAENLNILVYLNENSNDNFDLGTDTLIYQGKVRGILQGDLFNYFLPFSAPPLNIKKDFRIEWNLPIAIGNIVQTDKAGFDIVFKLNEENNNVVADWHFNENSGSSAYDSSGQDNDGVINGAVWADGKYNSALSFDGVDDYVDCGNDSSMNNLSSLTLEGWINLSAYSASRGEIVGKYLSPAPYRSYEIYVNNNGTVDFRIGIDNGSLNSVRSTTSLNLNQWHYVAGVYDGSKIKIYLNGILEKTKIVTGNIGYDDCHVNIGRIKPGDSNFNGLIDEVKIYSYALSDDEIATNYQKGN